MATLQITDNRPSGDSHADGKAYFETSTNKMLVWNATAGAWVEIDSDGTGAAFQNRWGASFDGSDDYVAPSSNPNINVEAASFWFKPTSMQNAQIVSGLGSDDGGFGISSAGDLRWYGSPFYVVNWGSGFLTAGNWYHFAARFVSSGYTTTDGSSFANGAGYEIYINNVRRDKQITYGATTSPTPFATTNVFKIGREGGRSMYYFDGKIDEVALFTSSLSASDVSDIYNSGTPVDLGADGLNLSPDIYYRMGDDSNDSPSAGGNISSISDSSGNGNDAAQSDVTKQPTFSDLTGETIYS